MRSALLAAALAGVGCAAAPLATPTAGAARPTAAPTASPAPNEYVNLALGYRVALPPPWRRSDCLSSTGATSSSFGSDVFTVVPEAEESGGGIGTAFSTINVLVAANQFRLTAEQWTRSPQAGAAAGQRSEPATLDGRPAVKVLGGALYTEVTYRAEGERMLAVGYRLGPEAQPNDEATMRAIVASFRFSGPGSARPATPTPLPRSAESVADALADGFARKDIAALTSLLGPCVTIGLENAGASFQSRAKFIDTLRESFGRGLSVVVRPRPLTGGPGVDGTTLFVETAWTDPGAPPQRIDLVLRRIGGTYFWTGTLRRQPR